MASEEENKVSDGVSSGVVGTDTTFADEQQQEIDNTKFSIGDDDDDSTDGSLEDQPIDDNDDDRDVINNHSHSEDKHGDVSSSPPMQSSSTPTQQIINETTNNINETNERVQVVDNNNNNVIISNEINSDNGTTRNDDGDNINTTKSPSSRLPNLNNENISEASSATTPNNNINNADYKDSQEELPPTSPPRLSNAPSSPRSPKSTTTTTKSSVGKSPQDKTTRSRNKAPPQSQKSSPIATTQQRRNSSSASHSSNVDKSTPIFGPFVDPLINSDWNPFGAQENNENGGQIFAVDDDDDIQQQNEGEDSNDTTATKQQQQSKQSTEVELDSLRRVFDSEYERALEDQEISWRARYGATRLSFIMSSLLMVVYLWLGCMFYRSEAGWSIPDALLFTVYTVTTVGYGGPQPLPNTAAFHAFTSMYVLVGISLVTVLGAHTYQLVTLETTKLRSGTSPWSKRYLNRHDGTMMNQDEHEGETEGTSGELAREIDKYREQFMNELEDLVRERPLLDASIMKIKDFRLYLRNTKMGRFLAVALPFLGMIFLGAIVVGTIEEWSPLESIYWSIVTLTTVGYGDYVPTKNSSVWFCTLFFIPSSLFFLSFLLAHVAKSYIRLHAIHVTRLERKMRRENERRRTDAEREERAKRIAEAAEAIANVNPSSEGESIKVPEKPAPESPGGTTSDDVEKGFTTIISYTKDQDDLDNSPVKRSGLFGDEAGNFDDDNNNDDQDPDSSPAQRYRENVIRNKDAAPDHKSGNRAVTFAEAHQSLDRSHSSRTRLDEFANESQQQQGSNSNDTKPSLDVRLRVQARLARIIAEEVAGYQTSVIIKGSTVSLTIGSLRDTSEKWKIPPQAWKAFRAVSFRSLLFVGERELISDGGDALLRLNVVEFHQIFSPMLAAMGDGSSMEAWLAATDVLADVELRGGSRYGKTKPIFSGTFT